MKAGLFAFFASLLLIHVSGQRNVWNFQTVTWNSRGARWNVVAHLMQTGVDVIAVQESGARPTIGALSNTPQPQPPRDIIQDNGEGILMHGNFAPTEEIWTIAGTSYFLYYYDRSTTDAGVQIAGATSQHNMAIVSRHRAQHIFIIPAEVPRYDNPRRQDRAFINRPVIGIFIGNSLFFNLHPEPTQGRNEAATLISILERFISRYFPSMTWMAMGDFNRTPNLMGNLISTNPAMTMTPIIVHPNVATRGTAILDYCIVGGPLNVRQSLAAITAGLVQNLPPGGHGSDHHPVGFH